MKETAAIYEMGIERGKQAFITAFRKTDTSFAVARSNKMEAARQALYLVETCRLTHREIGELVDKDKSFSSRLVKWARTGFPDEDMWGNKRRASAHADPKADNDDDPEEDDEGADPEQERQPNKNGGEAKDDAADPLVDTAEGRQLWILMLESKAAIDKVRSCLMSSPTPDWLVPHIEHAIAEWRGVLAHVKDEVEPPRVESISEDFRVLSDCGGRWAVLANAAFGNFYDKAAAQRWADAQEKQSARRILGVEAISKDFELANNGDDWSVHVNASFGSFDDEAEAQQWADAQEKMAASDTVVKKKTVPLPKKAKLYGKDVDLDRFGKAAKEKLAKALNDGEPTEATAKDEERAAEIEALKAEIEQLRARNEELEEEHKPEATTATPTELLAENADLKTTVSAFGGMMREYFRAPLETGIPRDMYVAIVNCLHPDKPTPTPEQRAQAFTLLQKWKNDLSRVSRVPAGCQT